MSASLPSFLASRAPRELSPADFHDYQVRAIQHQCSNPVSALWLFMSAGKEQPNSEPILTPEGWRPMGDLRIGDRVIGRSGKPVEVLGVHPQGVKEVVKLTFTDGATVRCGWDHLWYVERPQDRSIGREGSVRTTRELVQGGLYYRCRDARQYKWHIPLMSAAQLPEQDLPLDPYLLGVILGDGSIRPCGYCSVTTDKEIIENTDLSYLRDHKTSSYTADACLRGFQDTFKGLGLGGKRSWEKFVPEVYLRGSENQRLALLQGLLDTDGHSGGAKGVEFSSTSEMLTDAVVDLVRSLGGTATKSEPRRNRYQNGVGRSSWRVYVKLPSKYQPFRLSRKLKKWAPPSQPPLRMIREWDVVGEEESTCITVDAIDFLYVTHDYVVTHNTVVTLTSISHLQAQGWLGPTLVVAPKTVVETVWEQQSKEWTHLRHLKFAKLTGDAATRLHRLHKKADVYLINYENLAWLSETLIDYFLKQGRNLPFNGVVWDEISKMKNADTKRVQAFYPLLRYFKWRTGLTGTPAGNGVIDLHGQFYVLDGGYRLGVSKPNFEERFTRQTGMYGREQVAGAEQIIKTLISDVVLEMDEKDYLSLPDLIINDIPVELPLALRLKYDELEQDMFLELDSGTELDLENAAAKTAKCIAEGTEVLTEDGWIPIEAYNGSRVWDGVEWVNTSGLHFQGYRFTVECFNTYMTPDHEVLTNIGWKTAEEVLRGESCEGYDRQKVRIPHGHFPGGESSPERWIEYGFMEGEMRLWVRNSGCWAATSHVPRPGSQLRVSSRGSSGEGEEVTWNDRAPSVEFLVRHVIQVFESIRQRLPELWRKGYQGMRKMAEEFLPFLGRYGAYVSCAPDARASRQFERIFSRELQMGNFPKAEQQQKNLPVPRNTFRQDNRSSGCPTLRDKTRHDLRPVKSRVERFKSSRVSRVYDLANSGPRHRFTVRGADGVPLIVHNCLQFASGSVYTNTELKTWERVHTLKYEQMDRVIEEAAGEPVLASYQFRMEAEIMMDRYKDLKPVNLTGHKDPAKVIDDWVAGKIRLLVGHPASMGHGTDRLQRRGHILLWGCGLTWSLEQYLQFNARLRRQGMDMNKPVICHRVYCPGTLDDAQRLTIHTKARNQAAIRKAIKDYRRLKGL